MSFINRDFLTPSVLQWNSYSRLYHRFDKVWGKRMEGTVEVYNRTLIYWTKGGGYLPEEVDGRPSKFKRFLNALGIEYKEITKGETAGAENIFFTFDWSKLNYTKPTTTDIANKLNATIPIDVEFTLTVRYTGYFGDVASNHFTINPLIPQPLTTTTANYITDASSIIAELESNPVMYFANASTQNSGISTTKSITDITGLPNLYTPSASSSPLTTVTLNNGIHINSCLALLDNGTSFTKVGISNIKFQQTNTKLKTVDLKYDVTYKRTVNITSGSSIVNTIDSISNSISSVFTSGFTRNSVKYVTQDTLLKTAIKQLDTTSYTDTPLTYNGRLRVDSAAAMKRKDFGDILAKVLKVDYTEEDSEWYEVLLAVILIIVAIAVSIFSFGAGAGGPAGLATALGLGATVLSLGMVIYISVFPYASDMIRLIGKFAQIIGLAASIAGIFAAIQNNFNKLAQEAGKKAIEEQAKQGTSEAVLEELKNQAINNYGISDFIGDMFNKFFDDVKTKLTDMLSFKSISNFKFGDLTSITLNDVSGWLENLKTGMSLYNKFFSNDVNKNSNIADDQAVKEDGVEPFYASLAMLDDVDALAKMDKIKQESFGGTITDNHLIKMY